MTLSARNRLSGEVQNVEIDGLTAEITVEVADGQTVVAVITRRSAESLDLSEGDTVDAVIKATAVMIDGE
ncbi:DNA-binding transcriptional regulator ModE [Halalkalicoccus paucihalophilus]|uniref:DNA-binding transcriptional regulator ModE n=1 Tax=Halalkalicoccus paucihalophilus TaxID=1008153 RepID=A0A151AHE6_9EURY|nr:TOBE domain-containing protein [Halalkalicoccus paucihalophilus]KYH27066.1 DNA-binding transcriptional regulator ModE [Halalkalicoccus paucihalophilus]